MRRIAAVALVLALGSSLSGCGDPEQKYCDALRQHRVAIDEMINAGTGEALLNSLPTLQDLGNQAPDDLTDEWQTFVNAVTGLNVALHQAGVKTSDFRDGKIPSSVTGDDRQGIVAAADTLSSDEVVDAVTGIETQARDVCKVNLGL